MSLDTAWALQQLREFYLAATPTSGHATGATLTATYSWAENADIAKRVDVVEPILDLLQPRWRSQMPVSARDPWHQHRSTAARAIAQLQAAQRVQTAHTELGRDVSGLYAAVLHPWVWQAARARWATGHYRQAVNLARRRVQTETQALTARYDLTGVRLFAEAFSLAAPVSGSARLWVRLDEVSKDDRATSPASSAAVNGSVSSLSKAQTGAVASGAASDPTRAQGIGALRRQSHRGVVGLAEAIFSPAFGQDIDAAGAFDADGAPSADTVAVADHRSDEGNVRSERLAVERMAMVSLLARTVQSAQRVTAVATHPSWGGRSAGHG